MAVLPDFVGTQPGHHFWDRPPSLLPRSNNNGVDAKNLQQALALGDAGQRLDDQFNLLFLLVLIGGSLFAVGQSKSTSDRVLSLSIGVRPL